MLQSRTSDDLSQDRRLITAKEQVSLGETGAATEETGISDVPCCRTLPLEGAIKIGEWSCTEPASLREFPIAGLFAAAHSTG